MGIRSERLPSSEVGLTDTRMKGPQMLRKASFLLGDQPIRIPDSSHSGPLTTEGASLMNQIPSMNLGSKKVSCVRMNVVNDDLSPLPANCIMKQKGMPLRAECRSPSIHPK